MAGEDQYIHPIIQAMIAGQQQSLARQQLAQQLAQQGNENQARQQQLKIEQQRADQAEEQIHNEADYRKSSLENATQLLHAHLEQARQEALQNIPLLIKSGMDPGIMTGQAAPAQGQPDTRTITVGGLNIPISSLPTREKLLANEQQELGSKAQAVSAGTAAGKQPYDEAMAELQFGHQKALQGSTQDFQQRVKEMELDWDKTKEKMDTGTRMAIANLEAHTQNTRTEAEYGITPDQMQAGMGGLATGQIKANMTNPIDRRMATTFMANGGRVIDDKTAAAMRELGGMKDVYKKLDDLASQLPSEKQLGPIAATANALGASTIAHSALSTDLKNKINELAPQAYTILKNAQGYTGNRMNTNEMNYIQNGLTNIGTKEQALDYEQKLKDTIDNRMVNIMQVGMPKWQQNTNYHANGITPAWITEQANIDKQNPNGNYSKGLRPDIDATLDQGGNQVLWTRP